MNITRQKIIRDLDQIQFNFIKMIFIMNQESLIDSIMEVKHLQVINLKQCYKKEQTQWQEINSNWQVIYWINQNA
ncbi:unnamed protein product [Paramecium octaurelia]|uniref:Uncharacterized protein n=1 Tax=Paramecium octaurelia TaxID=43137 RepID=A0A8S1V7P8_PAROT|nr:unnamed protein product [Paramecium octaurelia]